MDIFSIAFTLSTMDPLGICRADYATPLYPQKLELTSFTTDPLPIE
jgi:hypothetical protein